MLIGGLAASLRGAPYMTGDVDICYAKDDENLERLARALRELGAQLRGPGVPEDLPFQIHPETFRLGDHFTFTTDAGKLDVMGVPSGTRGFADLEAAAEPLDVEEMTIRVASIDDLIAMKLAAGRTKDLAAAEELEAIKRLRRGSASDVT